MQEVNRLPIDFGRELRELVQLSLVFSPIVAVSPIIGQILQIGSRYSAAPTGAGQLCRPSGASQPVAQVGQFTIRYIDSEGMNALPQYLSVGHDFPFFSGTEYSVLIYYTSDRGFFKIYSYLMKRAARSSSTSGRKTQ